ncbi:hypothetical protein G7Y79_00061g093190 [Physcia stellaris]|nr:hypothetical protein G7Y79_00061g093190 [Physcia stellaris]
MDAVNATNAMNALPLGKSEVQGTYLQGDGKPFDELVTGAIIPHQTPGEERTILVLKRAAHEIYFPNIFEIPGGNVEDSDRSMADAVMREVLEETAMNVSKIIGAVEPFVYSMEKKITGADGAEISTSKTSLQLNFICEVTSSDFAVDPHEHSEGRFVRRSDVAEMDITDQMRAVVEEGFMWIKKNIIG